MKKPNCNGFTIWEVVQPSVPNVDPQMLCVIEKKKKKSQLTWINVTEGRLIVLHCSVKQWCFQLRLLVGHDVVWITAMSLLHLTSPHSELSLLKAFTVKTNRRWGGLMFTCGQQLNHLQDCLEEVPFGGLSRTHPGLQETPQASARARKTHH